MFCFFFYFYPLDCVAVCSCTCLSDDAHFESVRIGIRFMKVYTYCNELYRKSVVFTLYTLPFGEMLLINALHKLKHLSYRTNKPYIHFARAHLSKGFFFCRTPKNNNRDAHQLDMFVFHFGFNFILIISRTYADKKNNRSNPLSYFRTKNGCNSFSTIAVEMWFGAWKYSTQMKPALTIFLLNRASHRKSNDCKIVLPSIR